MSFLTDLLNRSHPAAFQAKLGDKLQQLITLTGELKTDMSAHGHAFTGGAISRELVTMMHATGASTTGTQLHAVPVDGLVAMFQSANANTADAYFATDGSKVLVDYAGSPSGYIVYYDEDAVADDSRFLINNSIMGEDMFVRTSSGKLLRLAHNAVAITTGVIAYFDDDAVTVTERMLYASPTAATSSVYTDDTNMGLNVVPTGTNAAALTIAADTPASL